MIEQQKTRYSDEQIFSALNPLLAQWFKQRFGSFTEPQKYAVLNIHARKNTLISAETGTGKTLAAFTAVLNELISLSENKALEDKVYCIYISPLRALSNDINKNLKQPLEEISEIAKKQEKEIGVRVAVRTGDTTTSERAKMLRKSPHILITTPESLAILLNSPKFIEKIRNVQWCIIDEIHALAENKRGVHLSLSMERLQKLSPELTRIGLSATVSPLEKMAEFLAGYEKEKPRECSVVDVSFLKKMDLKVISPLSDLVNSSQKQTSEALYELLDKLIQAHKTTLVFTNTRSATERVVHHLKDRFPSRYLEGNIGAHHSSLSREHRLNIEQRLKDGKLKAVVCSTSLELGIDIGFIDLVILLGSPKSVARAIQRMGRSGHKLHDSVKGRIIVLDRDDLVECAVLLKDALEKRIDKIRVPENCLDVLAQQIYGIAIADKIHIDELFETIRQSYCYRSLSRSDFLQVIDYLSGKFSELETRHVYAKIWFDEATGMIGRRGKLARVIYMTNIGTIPDEAHVIVKIKEQKIGMIDEGFLERLKRGDVFVLGGQSYEFRFASGMTAQVVSAEKRPPTVPSWVSETLPLSFDLAVDIGKFRNLMEEKFAAKKSRKEIISFVHEYLYVDGNAAAAIHNYFSDQYNFSEIPSHKKILVEQYKLGTMNHLIFHAVFGRRVNDALSRAFALMLGRLVHKDLELSMNDNGFMISCNARLPIERAVSLVASKELRSLLEQAIDKTELLGRRFRHCATRSLMILRNYKGREKSVARQQLNARLLLAAVKRLDENFSVLREARREVLEDLMDIKNTEFVIQGIEQKMIEVKRIDVQLPSPFAFNLFAQGYSEIMRIEERLEFVKRLHEQVQKEIMKKRGFEKESETE